MMLLSKKVKNYTIRTFNWTYYGDLFYFAAFKAEKINNNQGDFEFFNDFLYEYRVSRNVSYKDVAWNIFKSSAKRNLTPKTIDELALKYAETNKNEKVNKLTSLSSKLAMLLQPDKIIPMDSINKKAINHNQNHYESFAKKVDAFRAENDQTIQELMKSINPRAETIESMYSHKLDHLEQIRENRLVDKLLLSIGRS